MTTDLPAESFSSESLHLYTANLKPIHNMECCKNQPLLLFFSGFETARSYCEIYTWFSDATFFWIIHRDQAMALTQHAVLLKYKLYLHNSILLLYVVLLLHSIAWLLVVHYFHSLGQYKQLCIVHASNKTSPKWRVKRSSRLEPF